MIPTTFSPPGDALEPSPADSLRDGVWLMLRADNVTRAAYSFDAADPSRGVRIVAQTAHVDPADGMITVPQLIVSVAISNTRTEPTTSKAQEKFVTIAVMHLEAPDSSFLTVDVDAPEITPESRLSRIEQVLMRGTLYIAGQTTQNARVVDPYRSPLLESGLYDPEQVVLLNHEAPTITYAAPTAIARRVTPTDPEKLFSIEGLRDFAVAYGLFARYRVEITDRETQNGGF